LTDADGRSCYDIQFNQTLFTGVVVSTAYWSSTADQVFPSDAWSGYLAVGKVQTAWKGSELTPWPVRGGAR
jgi:hypothetical protein